MLSPLTPIVPSQETVAFASNLLRNLGRYVLLDTSSQQHLQMDAAFVVLMQQLLADLAAGRVVEITTHNRELSTFEAADLLGVSRQYLTKLLKDGKIPHRMVGSHHRVAIADLVEYKRGMDATTDTALSQLTRLSQDYGLY